MFLAGSQRYHEFKFVNGNEWESINNRSFIIDDSSPTQILDTFYFNDITPEDFIQQDVTVYFSVNMNYVETIADTVSLAGSFNNWTIGTDVMTDDDTDGIYTISIFFPAGSFKHQEYKYVNGFEYESINNRILEIDDSSSEMILDTVYFNDYYQNSNNYTLPNPTSTIKIYPNPFISNNFNKNNSLSFELKLVEPSKVIISIYNLKGEKIKTINAGNLSKGNHTIKWHNPDKYLKNGVYLYRFNNKVNKFIYLK